MALFLTVDRGLNVHNTIITFGEPGNFHGCPVWNLLFQAPQKFFPNQFCTDLPFGLIRDHVVREKVRVLPESWMTTYGAPVLSITSVNMLEREQLDGEWEILRPAKEVEELNILTADQLAALMREAEEIMAGWDKKMEGSIDDGEREQN